MSERNRSRKSIEVTADFSPSKSSLRSCSTSKSLSRRSVRRSVSFSDDKVEIHTVEKIATKKKEKDSLWFTNSEYNKIRTEAKVLVELLASVGKISEDENTFRGLEQMKAGDQARVQAARVSVLEKNEEMYAYFASNAVRKAQEIAWKDAKDAAAYQSEMSTEKSQTRKVARKGFLKHLSHRSLNGRS